MYFPFLKRLILFLVTTLTVSIVAASAATVTIDPKGSVTIPVNGVRQFTATVTGTTNTAVTWSLLPPAGVSASLTGTIDATGKYTAPPSPLPGFASLTIKVTSVADPTASASNTITVRYPIPALTSLSPNALPPGAFTLTVNGNKFVSGAKVVLNGVPLTTNFISSAQLTATGTATQLGANSIKVANPGPGAVSLPLTLTVSSSISVTVSPTVVSLLPNRTQQFQVTILGSSNQTVTWGVVGSPSTGVISSTGLYTAPSVPPLGGTVTVYAVAAADGVSKGSAAISIQDPQAITYGRFLEQATFGPTPALIAHAKQVGMAGFLNEQFAAPESSWPPLATATRSDAVDAFFANAFNGQDQLRQRVYQRLERNYRRRHEQEHERQRDHSVAAAAQPQCLRQLPHASQRDHPRRLDGEIS